MSTIQKLSALELTKVADQSLYTICGAGGELSEWVDGYEEMMAERGIGKPVVWYQVEGGDLNAVMADQAGGLLDYKSSFTSDLTILLFPLDDLDVGKLAMFKLMMQDRWLDDIIQNAVEATRRSASKMSPWEPVR